VIFSHSSTRALTDHPRNVPDDVLALLPKNGGVVMVSFVPPFTSEAVRLWGAENAAAEARLAALHPDAPERVKSELAAWRKAHPSPRATLAQVADHLDHARQVAGVDHVGLGSDFDGITSTVEGLDEVSKYPVLLAELLRRGWSEADVEKVAGLNVLRVLEEAEKVAARLQQERPPSDARIEDLDAATPATAAKP
ncbi:MAG TPA: membrane dipeptidase, partial [Thermoanaerobaculia bacterium]|nr:membrane dipeptidase [Thermoanaerobaculia bacterium]